MADIVGIIRRHGLTIKKCHSNQLTKLALCEPLIHFNNHLKQLYINNKMECFSYKGWCVVHGRTFIEIFKRRVGLDYR